MVIQHRKLPRPDYYRYSSGNWDTPASRTPASTGPKKVEYDPAERFPCREFPVTVKKIKKKAEGGKVTGATQGVRSGDGKKERGKSGRKGHRCNAGHLSR